MYTIGIDIGGNSTKMGLVSREGKVLKSSVFGKEHYTPLTHFIDTLEEHINKLRSLSVVEGKVELTGIGIGAPNANSRTGTIDCPPNLPWQGITPLAQLVEERTKLPVKLANDANAAAIGEMKYGAARRMQDIIVITLGTGVGSGIVANGQLLDGHNGLAGELGHTIVQTQGGRLCGCGRHGCLETYTSATGVAQTARLWLAQCSDFDQQPLGFRSLSEVEAKSASITAKDVYCAAAAGDPLARRIFEYTGALLGEAFANFAAFSDPEAFILFGGLTRAGDLLLDPLRESLERNLLPVYQGKIKVLISELPESDAAILGASALVI